MVKSFRAIPQLRSAHGMRSFQLNAGTQQLAPALMQALAGLLFVIPGLLTDVFALLLLLPSVQHWVQQSAMRKLANRQEAMQKVMMEQMRQHGFPDSAFTQDGFTQQGGFSGKTVDGEARTVEPKPINSPQIGRQPVNDD